MQLPARWRVSRPTYDYRGSRNQSKCWSIPTNYALGCLYWWVTSSLSVETISNPTATWTSPAVRVVYLGHGAGHSRYLPSLSLTLMVDRERNTTLWMDTVIACIGWTNTDIDRSISLDLHLDPFPLEIDPRPIPSTHCSIRSVPSRRVHLCRVCQSGYD